jgi:adenine specific DNA methylase Mod
MSRNLKDGVFYYGDNLPVLRDLPDESVDLIYLDPPFNSNVNYNAVFKDESGKRTDAQVKAFDDTWRWGAQQTYFTVTGEYYFHKSWAVYADLHNDVQNDDEITNQATPDYARLVGRQEYRGLLTFGIKASF